MVGYAKRNVAMVTSIGAMAVAIMLIIFFGAWAVAESSDGGFDNFAASATSGFVGTQYQAGSAPSAADTDTAPRLASANPASETWWGKSFLFACPLH